MAMLHDAHNAENGPQNYAPTAPERRVPNAFEHAIRLLIPWTNARRKSVPRFPGRLIILAALLEDRAHYETVKKWRAGTRRAPQWAKDILASHLERDAHERLKAAAALRNEKGAR